MRKWCISLSLYYLSVWMIMKCIHVSLFPPTFCLVSALFSGDFHYYETGLRWVCVTILVQFLNERDNDLPQIRSTFSFTASKMWDELLVTFICNNLISQTHFVRSPILQSNFIIPCIRVVFFSSLFIWCFWHPKIRNAWHKNSNSRTSSNRNIV